MSHDNQTHDLSLRPFGSAFSLSGLAYNNANGQPFNNNVSETALSTSVLIVSGLDILNELNSKASTTASTNGLSQNIGTSTFTWDINQTANLSGVNTISGLHTLVKNNTETILPIESNGSSTKFTSRVGSNALIIET